MSFIIYLIMGLVAGALAKFIMPGKDPGGIFITLLLGIAGSMIGGFVGGLIGLGGGGLVSISGLVLAVLGALLLLWVYRLYLKKKSSSKS